MTVTKPFLRVKGYIIEDDDGNRTVNPLMDALSLDEEFSATFELQPSSFKDTEFEMFSVRSFDLEFLIFSGGASRE